MPATVTFAPVGAISVQATTNRALAIYLQPSSQNTGKSTFVSPKITQILEVLKIFGGKCTGTPSLLTF